MLALAALAACDSGTEERAGGGVDPGACMRRTRRHPARHGLARHGRSRGGPGGARALPPRRRFSTAAANASCIFCSPCHGASGRGDGLVVSRGFPAPPSYHQERLPGRSVRAHRVGHHQWSRLDVLLCRSRSARGPLGRRALRQGRFNGRKRRPPEQASDALRRPRSSRRSLLRACCFWAGSALHLQQWRGSPAARLSKLGSSPSSCSPGSWSGRSGSS